MGCASRRAFLTSAAAVGAVALIGATATAAALQPDPVFAAIERHRRAYQDYMDNLGEDEIEALVPAARRRSSLIDAVHGNPDWQIEGDDPRWIAHVETAIRTGDEHENASVALVSSEVLSLTGVIALLEYVASVEAKDPEGWPLGLIDDNDKRHTWHFFLMEHVAAALTGMVRA